MTGRLPQSALHVQRCIMSGKRFVVLLFVLLLVAAVGGGHAEEYKRHLPRAPLNPAPA